MSRRILFAACVLLSAGNVLAATGLPQISFQQSPRTTGHSTKARPLSAARTRYLPLPKGKIPLTSLAKSQGYVLRYDPGPDVYRLTNGSHNIVVGPGMLHVLIDGNPYQLASRPAYVNGCLIVPGTLAGYISRLKSYSTSSRFGYSGKTGVGSISLRRVVIDPGHGGRDPGAIGRGGYKEKTINLQVSRYLAQILRSKGVQVIMTRDSDRFVDLHRRAHIANSSHADLFVSIHANAARSRWVQGIETFCLTSRISDYARSKRAARMYDGRSFGLAYRTASSERSSFQRALKRDRYRSKRLAGFVQRRLISSSGDKNRGVRTENLCVLRESYIPAILVEIGFLSNSKTEIRFRSPSYQRALASAIAAGISDYSRYHPSRATRSPHYASRTQRPSRVASVKGTVDAMAVAGRSGLVSYSRR